MSGKTIRFNKLFGGKRNAALVAVDHGAEFGPTPGLMDFPAALENLAGADAILLNPGMVGQAAEFFGRQGAPLMVLRATWTTAYCFPFNYRESHTAQLISAQDALGAGADFIMACCLLQSGSELVDRENVKLFAEVVAQKEKAGIPLIGELFPVDAETMPAEELYERVYRGCRILAELGADAVKTFYTGEKFAEVIEGAGVPVLALGASKCGEAEALAKARKAMEAGARGVVFGRNVFQAERPADFLQSLANIIHGTPPPAPPRLQLRMVWPQERLRKPPSWSLPDGYTLRAFRAGDEAEYIRLMAVAGFKGWTPERIGVLLKQVLPNGFFVVEHDLTHRFAATASAQHSPTDSFPFGGQLGWVAGDPEHKGKGLGYAVSAAAVKRLLDAGYFSIYLLTDDNRLPAVHTYLKMGFVPLLFAPDMAERWRAVCAQLGVESRQAGV